MSEDRKWKRGDIGPDGKVFAGYRKDCKNGERWLHAADFDREKRLNSERSKQWAERNPEKRREIENAGQRKRNSLNPLKNRKRASEWIKKNPGRARSTMLCCRLKKTFEKRDGSSLSSFLASIRNSHLSKSLDAIMKLQDISKKPLSEMIYDLSGYDMSVCEEIANLCKGEFPDA